MLLFSVVRTCDNCGCDFTIHHRKRMEYEHVFCCKKCQGEFRKSKSQLNTKCEVCGLMYHLKPSQKMKSEHHCCSFKCLGELRKNIFLGQNNPNYGNRGQQNPLWKSDLKMSPYGYVLIRQLEHPFRNCDGFVFEHRLVAQKYLLTQDATVYIDGKAYLSPQYDVHHIDRNRTNNSPQNLMVLTKSQHMKLHQSEKHK